ncbi:MAG: PEGA domain-containing protein [Nitrospirota bacterium]
MGSLVFVAQVALGTEVRVTDQGKKGRSSVELSVEAPSYGPAPGGTIYGGPYYPPSSGYYPYPYYPWPPQSYYPPAAEPRSSLIPAGRLYVMVDPVDAEVLVDGLRLRQNNDLSYEVGLLVGPHTLTVRAEGYDAYEEAIEIPGGQHVVRTVRLSPVKR